MASAPAVSETADGAAAGPPRERPDPCRLAEEAAILADRSDVEEELSRWGFTLSNCGDAETGGEVGKKPDFLLQEMNRETNTILSKTSGIGEGD